MKSIVKSNPSSVISKSEIIRQAERNLEADTELKRSKSRENHLDSNNWLENNLEFLGKALQTNFEGAPRGTCTKFVNETKTWCGKKAWYIT